MPNALRMQNAEATIATKNVSSANDVKTCAHTQLELGVSCVLSYSGVLGVRSSEYFGVLVLQYIVLGVQVPGMTCRKAGLAKS